MLRRSRLLFGALAALVLVVALGATPATAETLDELRASGAVGERFDGFLAAREPGAQAFVDRVNAKRRSVYEQRASAEGVPVDQVGQVYAQEILDDAPPGTFFQKPDGSWMQK